MNQITQNSIMANSFSVRAAQFSKTTEEISIQKDHDNKMQLHINSI